MTYKLTIEGQTFDVDIQDISGGIARVAVNGAPYEVAVEMDKNDSQAPAAAVQTPRPSSPPVSVAKIPAKLKPAASGTSGIVLAPIPGLILKINVSVGDTVSAGQCVVVMEAMKMENDIPSPISGTVSEIRVQKGMDVNTGEVILVIT
jgi:biotin carboxyl carrier protein